MVAGAYTSSVLVKHLIFLGMKQSEFSRKRHEVSNPPSDPGISRQNYSTKLLNIIAKFTPKVCKKSEVGVISQRLLHITPGLAEPGILHLQFDSSDLQFVNESLRLLVRPRKTCFRPLSRYAVLLHGGATWLLMSCSFLCQYSLLNSGFNQTLQKKPPFSP